MLQDQQFKFANHLEFESKDIICTAQISDDENFLAIGGYTKNIQIFYLKNKKLIRNIKLDCEMRIIKFSKDSEFFLSGDNEGYLYFYEITNFKLKYKCKVHQGQINDMILIFDDQILTCSKESLIITDFKQQQQLLKIQNDNQSIYAVEYDKSRNYIIYSDHNEIYFVNRQDGEILIQFQTAPKEIITQLQLFKNSSNLVSSSYYYVYLWLVDYKNLRLIKTKEFTHYHFNFTSISNNNKLILICYEFVFIIDSELVIIQKIKHNINQFLCNYLFYTLIVYFKTCQLNSLNFIIIQGKEKLQVLKRRR